MNLSIKYKRKLQELDYIHLNAQRTSNEVRDVLRVPTREILRSCEIIMDKKQITKKELENKKKVTCCQSNSSNLYTKEPWLKN